MDGALRPLRHRQRDRDPRPAPSTGRAAAAHSTTADQLERPRRDRRPRPPTTRSSPQRIPDYPGHDPALAPTSRPTPLDHPARPSWPTCHSCRCSRSNPAPGHRNPTWGYRRVHGELGYQVGASTVAATGLTTSSSRPERESLITTPPPAGAWPAANWCRDRRSQRGRNPTGVRPSVGAGPPYPAACGSASAARSTACRVGDPSVRVTMIGWWGDGRCWGTPSAGAWAGSRRETDVRSARSERGGGGDGDRAGR
jgi:hypothetical protein